MHRHSLTPANKTRKIARDHKLLNDVVKVTCLITIYIVLFLAFPDSWRSVKKFERLIYRKMDNQDKNAF